MSCERLRKWIASGQDLGHDWIERHARDCDPCGQLLESPEIHEALSSPEFLLGELQNQIAGERASLWTRWRSLTPRRIVTISLLCAGAMVAYNALGSPRGDFDAYPRARMIATLALLTLGFAAALRLCLWPLHSELPTRRRLVSSALLWGAIPLLLALLPVAHHQHHAHPESFADAGAMFWPKAIACLLWGVLMALPFLVAIGLTARQSPTRMRVSSLIAMMAAGSLVGGLSLQLHCPLVSQPHLVLGHWAVTPLLILVAVLVRELRRGKPRRTADALQHR